jgi:hypothetical protein
LWRYDATVTTSPPPQARNRNPELPALRALCRHFLPSQRFMANAIRAGIDQSYSEYDNYSKRNR